MRKIIVAGNWKMNKTRTETEKFFKELLPLVEGKNVEIVVAAPFTNLETAIRETKDSNIKIAAQNMNPKDNGAYTGEISPLMLKDLGVEYVLVGHSERREYYKECNKFINEKVLAAIHNGLKPILCFGETLEQREANITEKVVEEQLREGLKDVCDKGILNVVLAYEPVWAIGTGKTATAEQAQEVHAFIRNLLVDMYGADIANEITVQYGGSMKPENALELMKQNDIDGGLIGGAALDPISFAKLVEAGSQI
ncbi:triose-phosphate isomerase [Streptobacillus moniliformis]|uniref:Triosephosphate isomerase n=1 Tax=Streptobacillus moniliformis (strain ATCC 14647 / DSM 12112 / NCTC 10651 / 9901) TaxID=519441 RepID=D1AY87_STRM9|nr:triose-phosphate isomerase [Streptobacillus moniliformis]ACZ01263.1 triosephosphate isomerase [Streptobacillus moniliformis DSM 12112]AVL42380.1 triose-phosphate isomerase [Streptobacillus moniliformis]QXW66005.1 triose-phosphate isomerase [Streptobacillus moniliformis]SQA13580.1 Bifunctional PGK/TIM [Streptobacillus moniliformis]SQA14357.1 Bifunctional PGK/TIM [Streptobacillus moniliformis]